MKFPNEYKNIFKITNEYVTDIHNSLNNFKTFCEDITNDNSYTNEWHHYTNIHKTLIGLMTYFKDNIQDNVFAFQQMYSDVHRPSVLFPYENQAIWEYLTKPDMKHHCYKKFGCMYAEKIIMNGEEAVTIGISICNDKDEFSKNIALSLAKKRAREYPTRYDIRVTPRFETFPFSRMVRIPLKTMYENEIAKFVKRCTRWFKNETIIYPNNIDFVEFPKKIKKKNEPTGEKKMPF